MSRLTLRPAYWPGCSFSCSVAHDRWRWLSCPGSKYLESGRVIALTPLERQQTISAPVDGRVVRWHVVEGTRVKQGDVVVDVSDNDPGMIERLRERTEFGA